MAPKSKRARLRVDSVAALSSGGSSGPALVPGDPDRSRLISAVRSAVGADGHMPPTNEPQLSAAEVITLAAWVRGLSTKPRNLDTEHDAPGGDVAAEPSTETPAEPSAGPAANLTAPDMSKLPARIQLFHGGVMPILKERCGRYHAGKGAGEFSVDSGERLMAGGSSGPAVIAGEPDRSPLIQRVELPLAAGDHMPPDGEAQLGVDEIAVLRHWVESGAALGVEADVSELPAAVQRGVAVRPPPPLANRGERAVAAARRAGGCGACRLGSQQQSPIAAAVGFGIAICLALRRRRRNRRLVSRGNGGMLRPPWVTTVSRR
jgi:hypothetical protein